MAETLGQAVLEVGVDDSRLRAGLRGVEQQATRTGQTVQQQLNGAFSALQGTLATIGAAAIFRDLIRSATELENITRKLTNTLGDQGAQQALGFLRGLSDRLGLSFNVLADSFGSFTAAASAANIPLGEQKDLFAAVSTSAQRLGLSNDAINGSLLALQQVAAKGTVQMEELRGQLGERLPTAFAATARGLGVTNAELIKLVESGRLTAEQFFPALTRGLNELNGSGGGALPTATQNFASFGNELEKLKAAIGTELLPGVLAFTQALSSGLAGPVKSELVNVNNAISFLKDTIAEQTEFGVDTREAQRKLAELEIKAEELQTKLGRLNREDEIKTEVLNLERQRRELERQGVATDVITEKTKALSQELFLLNGSTESVPIGQIFNGLTQDQIRLTPVVTDQLKEARAEQEKITEQLEIQRAARARLIVAGKDTAAIDARIVSLQEREAGLRAGLGVTVLDRIQKEKDAEIQRDREEQARDAKRLNTQDKINARLKEARKQLGGLDINSGAAQSLRAEIERLQGLTPEGGEKARRAVEAAANESKKIADNFTKAADAAKSASLSFANVVAGSRFASESAQRQARETLEKRAAEALNSGAVNQQAVAREFGLPVAQRGSLSIEGGGQRFQRSFSGQVGPLDLRGLGLDRLSELVRETSPLADGAKSVQESNKELATAVKELNANIGKANERESNLAVTVAPGETRRLFLP